MSFILTNPKLPNVVLFMCVNICKVIQTLLWKSSTLFITKIACQPQKRQWGNLLMGRSGVQGDMINMTKGNGDFLHVDPQVNVHLSWSSKLYLAS